VRAFLILDMAEGKKSFILYSDMRGLFDRLPQEKAGALIQHIFAYVNDENPATDDIVIEIAFEPIKNQLKRDLKKWKNQKDQRSGAGKASAAARKRKSTNVNEIQRKSTNVNEIQRKSTNVNEIQRKSTGVNEIQRKSTVNVNDNVNDNVNVNVIEHSSCDEQRASFDLFWNKYDHKIDKGRVRKKWDKLSEKDREAIMQHLKKYIPNTFKDKYPTRRHPTTYLSNRTWENDVIELPKEDTRPKHVMPTPADIERVLPGVFKSFTEK